MDQPRGVADLSQSSVSSEEIYAEAMPNPREQIEAASVYFKEQYAILAKVCEDQQRKIEEMSKMQGSDVFELQNQLFEQKSQRNSTRMQNVAEVRQLKRQNEAIMAHYEDELARQREDYERQMQELEAATQGQLTQYMASEKSERSEQIKDSQMVGMIEQLQMVNLKLQEERAELANRLNKQRLQFAEQQEKLRAEMTTQISNMAKAPNSSGIELRETKKQLDDLLDRYSLLTIQNNKLKAQRDSLHRALEDNIDQLSSLKQELQQKDDELQAKSRELEAALRRVPIQDESYSKILDDSKAERSGERQIELLHEELSRLRNNYDAQMSVLYQKEIELNHEKEARASKQEETAHFRQLYEQSKKLQEHADQQLERLKRLYKQKEEELEEIKKAEEAKRAHHKQSLQQSQDHIRKLNEYINQSQGNAEADKSKLLNEVTRLNSELAERESKLLTMKLELIQVKDAYETERELMGDLRRRMLELQGQQATTSKAELSKLSRLQQQLRSSDSFEVNSESRNSQYVEQLKQATERLTRENQRMQKELEQANSNYLTRLEACNQQNQQLSSENREVSKQLDSERRASQRIIDRLQLEMAQKESEFEKYRQKTQQALKTDRASAEQYAELELRSKVSKMEDLAVQVNDLKKLNSDLAYKLSLSGNDLKELSQVHQERVIEVEELRQRISQKIKQHDTALRQLDSKTSEYNYCKQLLTARTLELEQTKTRLNLKLLEDEGKTRQSVVRMETMVSQQQLNLKDEQMRIISNELAFQKEIIGRLQSQLAKQKELAEDSSRKEFETRSQFARLQSKVIEQTSNNDYQKIVEDTSRLNQQLNQEVRRCYEQVAELQKELHERSMIRTESSLGQSEQVRQMEKIQSELYRELAQVKLELGTYQTKQKFLEVKLQELRREKDAMSSVMRDKRAIEEELKNKEEELTSVERERALLEHESDLLRQDNITKDHSIASLRTRLAQLERNLQDYRSANEEFERQSTRTSMELTLKSSQIVQYRQELLSKEEGLIKSQESIQKLTRQLAQAREAVSELGKQNQESKAAFEAMKSSLNQKLGQIDDWKRQEKHLSRSIEEKQNQQESLKRLLQKRQIELADSNAYSEQLKEQAQRIIDTLRKEVADQKQQIEVYVEEKARSEREFSTHRENMERRVTYEQNKFKEELEAVKRENAKTQESRNQQSAKLREATTKFEQLQEKLQQIKSERNQLEKLLSDAEHHSRDLDNKLNEESSANRRLSGELKQIKQQTSLQNGQYDKLLQQFELLKSKNSNEVDQLQKTLQEMNNRFLAEKRFYEEKNNERLRDQSATFNRLTSDNGKLEFELKSVNKQLQEQRQIIAKYKHERQGLHNELTVSREQKIQLEKELANRQDCLRSFEERVKALTSQIDHLKHQNTSVTFRDARLEDSMIQAERQKLLEYVAELEKKCKTLESNQNSNSRSRLAIRYGDNTRVTELQTEIETLKGTVKRLQGQINSLTNQNARLFAQASTLNNTILQLRMENERLSINPGRSERDYSTIQNLQVQLDRLNNILLDKEEEISRLRNTGTVITKIDYLQPEYVAPSPLNFHTLVPTGSNYQGHSHIAQVDPVVHSQQYLQPIRFTSSQRAGTPAWTNSSSSNIRYELQAVPVTNSLAKQSYSTMNLSRPY